MKKIVLISSMFAFIATGLVYMSSCSKNPVTGRNSLDLVDDASMMSLSNQEYSSFLSTNPPMTGPQADAVKAIGAKMTSAVRFYLDSKGQLDLLKDYVGEFNLVNNADANAWCLPGGKVVVYTGILPLTLNDTALAVVMGHEIAHAVAKHGNERMSQQLLAQYGGAALSVVLSQKPAETQQLFGTLYGISTTLGTLAYSRKQENEADEMGLYFTAMAGYNPTAAIAFWQRMAAQGGSKPPVLLSTHPSDEDRINHIREILPKAMTYYHP